MMNTVTTTLRRHIRLSCHVKVGALDIAAHTVDISARDAYIRIPRAQLASAALEIGAKLALKLDVPSCDYPVDLWSRVFALYHDDVDPEGRPSVGVSLMHDDVSASVSAELTHVIDTLRQTILVIDDDPQNLDLVEQVLSDQYVVLKAASASEAWPLLSSHQVSVVVIDERMAGQSGLEFLAQLSESLPYSYVRRIMLSAFDRPSRVYELVRTGQLFAYLTKPINDDELLQVVRRAVDAYAMAAENARLNRELEEARHRLGRENAYLRRRVSGFEGFGHILGSSAALRQALVELDRIRHATAPVHIQGETGTGKELVARGLHFGGPRQKGPFVAQNCAGMAESLLQTTLFGHEKGAFTGADRSRPGVFQEAHGGTLFLDEVADLSPMVQAALLRALQEGEVVPVGATRPIKVEVSIISATHKDLREEVRQGWFREDLYFRLVVMPVRLPPLRERVGDVSLLAHHFLDLYCVRYGKNVPGFTQEAIKSLESYSWPGNIRELENEVQRLVVLADDGAKIDIGLLSPNLRPGTAVIEGKTSGVRVTKEGVSIPFGTPYEIGMDALERALVEWALRRGAGVVTRAAELLQIKRSRMTKIKQRLGFGGDDDDRE